MSISAAQCRAARGLLGLSQDELAKAANISRATLSTFEAGLKAPWSKNLEAIRSALEGAGVQFIPENGGGVGVRFRDPLKDASEQLCG